MKLIQSLYFCFLALTLSVVNAQDTLPSITWKMSKTELMKNFEFSDIQSNHQLRTSYRLNNHDFILSFSFNNDYVVAYSMQYKGPIPKQAYQQMKIFFQDLYGPGEEQSTSKFSKFECRKDRSTDLRMMLMKEKLFILITPKRKF